ncbi:MAG: hypothetical protein ACF8R7_14235 [Phycisphaerales bacterium JB039]
MRLAAPLRVLSLLGLAALLAGCALDRNQETLARYHAEGRYDAAAKLLDDPDVQENYGVRSRTLWLLERGAVALANGDRDKTVEVLNTAEVRIARQRRTALDNIGQWTINDRTAPYQAAPHEDMYVNVIKMLAHLEAGVIYNGASVEARRYIDKTQYLRQWSDAMFKATGDSVPGGEDKRAQLRSDAPAEFIESPLGTFLAAVTFMREGKAEFQRVAALRLDETIQRQGSLIGAVKPESFEGLAERQPAPGQLLVVALSGRAPTKHAERIPPLLFGDVPIYFEIPVLSGYSAQVGAADLEFDTGERVSLDLIELTGRVAEENYKRMLPAIYTRAFLRAAAKSAAATVATRAVTDSNDDLRWLMRLAGLGMIVASERADLRTWIMLPARADGALLEIPAGASRARIVYRAPGGATLHTTEWTEVAPEARDLTTIVTHYWR